MAYYFMAETKKGTYAPLNIHNSKYFSSIPKYSKPCACTLQEIDIFTMMFNDETELRNSLLIEGILPVNLSTKPLTIRILNKGKYSKVMYGFLYQKDIEYIMEPTRLIELIIKRYHQNDFAFIKSFANNFSNFHGCNTTAPEVARLAEDSIRTGKRNIHLDDLDENHDHMVARLIKLLILEHYNDQAGKTVYKDKVNYRNLHSVIAFINHYDEKNKVENLASKKEEPTPQPDISISQTIPQKRNDAKKLSRKKNYQLEGQFNFNDLL